MTAPAIENIYRLTPLQEGMLFHTLYEPGGGLYVEQVTCTLAGALDVAALRRAWGRVVARHPALRSSFHWQEVERPVQVVFGSAQVPWEELDWRELAPAGLERRWGELLAADRRRGFALETPPLLRFTLVRLGAEEHRFLWSSHHLLLDGWSVSLVLEEVFALYEAYRRGTEVELPLPRPYADYVAWLAARDGPDDEAFWRRELAGLAGPTRVGGAAEEGAGPAEIADLVDLEARLPAAQSRELDALAKRSGLTLATVVQGAFGLLLGHLAGSREVVFGAVAAGRPPELAGAERMVGMFINTLPVRLRLPGEVSVAAWLADLQRQQLALRRHEHVPLSRLRRWSGLPAGEPLFEALLAFENYPRDADLLARSGGLSVRDLDTVERTNYPLNLSAVPGEELAFRVTYDRRRIGDGEARRLLPRLLTLLEAIATDPGRSVAALPLLPAAERRELLAAGAGLAAAAPAALDGPFRRQAARRPEAVAVEEPAAAEGGPTEHWSYGELARRSCRLAARLAGAGAGPESLVGLSMERSAAAVTALLGILEAGAAALPLDPDHPAERLAALLADAAPAAVMTTPALAERLPAAAACPVILDDGHEDAGAGPAATPPAEPERLAYVIYTSGSTGRPKGVAVPHRGAANTLAAARGLLAAAPGDRVLQAAALSFDASVLEIFLALGAGATLSLAHPETLLSGAALVGHLRRHGVSVLVTIPSLLDALPAAELPALRAVTVGAEACRGATARRWGAGRRLFNLYAPTEASIFATAYDTGADPAAWGGQGPPIGRPIAGATAHVLGPWGGLAPAGAPGELALGGAGIARGYLGEPARTAECFVPDPFSGHAGGRLYLSGDRARRRAPMYTAELVFLGRNDRQLKVRGFRVEPGEVEAALAAHPAVAEAAVLPWRAGGEAEGEGPLRLAAYAAPALGLTLPAAGELRRFLGQRLPAYMVPAAFVPLAHLPRTPSGKLDRRALPAPDPEAAPTRAPYRPPSDEAARLLAAIWAQVLGVERVGLDDNFFDLGGDSILSLQILSRATEAGLALTPRQIFEYPTVAELAAVSRRAEAAAAQPASATGPAPLTPIQSWFFERGFADPQVWNLPVLLETGEALEPALLERALEVLVARHDALRLYFDGEGEARRQQVAPAGVVRVPLARCDLSALPAAAWPRALAAAGTALGARFDLARGPLFAAALFDLGAGRPGRLLLAAHHLVVDAVSWRVLVEEIETLYRQLEAGRPPALGPPTLPFTAWAERLADDAGRPEIDAELAFWHSLGEPPPPSLPRDTDGGASLERDAASVAVELAEATTQALLTAANEAYQTRAEELLLAALALAFGRWCGGPRLWVHLEAHGREDLLGDADVSRTVGWLTRLYPALLAAPVGGGGEAIKAVKEQLRRIPRRGAGWGLLRYARPETSAKLAAIPHPEVVFNYLGRIDAGLTGSSLFSLASEPAGPAHSPRAERAHLLEINVWVHDGRLRADLRYGTRHHRAATVEALAGGFRDAIEELVAHCLSSEAGGYTPSDFPAAGLGQEDLDAFLGRLAGEGKPV